MRNLQKIIIILILQICLSAHADVTREDLQAYLLAKTDFHPFDENRAQLGQLLFYDKVISGNRNISCGTCHHHDLGTTDRLPLGIGEGGVGLGPNRTVGIGSSKIKKRVPRNAPALFNLGAKERHTLFHDGRLTIDPDDPTGFNSPAEEKFPQGIMTLTAAQALFPLTSEIEMAGQIEENEIAGATRRGFDWAWREIAKRIQEIDQYIPLFQKAYADEISGRDDITITHIANAIGDFINSEWQASNSKFDAYVKGIGGLTHAEYDGMQLFFGKGNCSACHTGALFTDQQFHSLALPQFGPGRTRKFDTIARDQGRLNESDDLADAYKFRTPSLRNVEFTAPYGHNGAYATLKEMIAHIAAPLERLSEFDKKSVSLPEHSKLAAVDFLIRYDTRVQTALRNSLSYQPVALSNQEIDNLVAFLKTLSDQSNLKGRLGRPDTVPSGLAVDVVE